MLNLKIQSKTLLPALLILSGVSFFQACSTKKKSEAGGTASACFTNYATNTEWGNEAPLVINGYTGNANEPRIYPDSNTIFFNDKPSADTAMQIHWASKDTSDSSGLTWTYQGELTGVNNSSYLDGTPAVWLDSVQSKINFFFVSSRNYNVASQYGMIFGGEMVVSGSAPYLTVPSVTSRDAAIRPTVVGQLDMDVDVAFDGSLLIVSRAVFSGNAYPDQSKLAFFPLDASGQALADVNSSLLLSAVNDPLCRVYAGNLSADKLELYYSAFGMNGATPVFHTLVAKRNSVNDAFGAGQIISAITGDLTEAPSISQNGKVLYYHRAKANGSVGLYRVTRP